jgi:uncharacterized repeat protein (TIGR01451 family)
MIRHRASNFALALASCMALVSCLEYSTNVELLEIDAIGAVRGLAFLDHNGNELLDAGDEPLAGGHVLLTGAQGVQVLQEAVTDTAGAFFMIDVPVGNYRLRLDEAILGDSLVTVLVGTDAVRVLRDLETVVNLGVSFPVLSIDEVRVAAPGRRVFTTGIALNPRQSFGDGLVHIQGDASYLRAINVDRGNIGTGDSIRLLGRTGLDNGHPVLRDVTPFELVNLAQIPIPVETTTGEATNASGGALDAALVRIREAEISDTATVGGDFQFTLDDGTGPVRVVLRSFLQLQTDAVRPDTVVWSRETTGLLVPQADETGQVTWRILPRGGNDVVLENKITDLTVGVTADPATASRGETVTLEIVALNAGSTKATGVEVSDTIPEGLTFVSASSTRGSYSSASGLWSLGTLEAGAADTLTIQVSVTTAGTGVIQNRVWAKPLVHEIDSNPFNNFASVAIQVTAAQARSSR